MLLRYDLLIKTSKIADFGFARIVDPKNGCSTKLGTVVY